MPNDNDVLDALGRAQVMSGDQQQAISTFRKLSAADNRKADPHIKLAELLRKSGDVDGAVSSLRKALDIDASDETAQAMMMDIQAASGKLQDALAMARAMQTRTPQAASGYMLEAALHKRNKNSDAALQAYRNGLKTATKKTELAVGLHGTLFAMNKMAEADAFSTSWRKENPSDPGFDNHLASTLILRTDYVRAEQLLQGVVAARPNHVTALNNLAWVLTALGKPGAAAHALRATEIQPNRPPLMDTLALALAAEKQYPKALEVKRKAIEIAPADMGLRLGLAKILLASGDKAAAKTELEKLAALGPKLPSQTEVARLLKQI
jgi:putative PEP-CTERM system TPR-repeat lipoprotein